MRAVNAAYMLTLTTDSGTYAVAGIRISVAPNAPSVAVVNLAIGRRAGGGIVNVELVRGENAQLTIGGSVTAVLFAGFIEDYGPSSFSFGEFAVQAIVIGKLSAIATGTLSQSNIVPKSYLDTAIIYPLLFGPLNEKFGLLDHTALDVWASLKRGLLNLTQPAPPPDSVTQTITDIFGGGNNSRVISVLQSIRGALPWNGDFDAGETAGIIHAANTLLHGSLDSFLQTIVKLGDNLSFAISELSELIRVLPFVPFFNSRDAVNIIGSDYSSLGPNFANFVSLNGCVLITASNARDQNGVLANIPAGVYKRPEQDPLGIVAVEPMPAVFIREGGDLVIDAARKGVSILDNADALARIACWRRSYENRTLTVSVPEVRLDVGPMTAVRVEFPEGSEIAAALEDRAVYGSVVKTSIALDAAKQFAATVYEIGYVRSERIQLGEIDGNHAGHPVWAANCVRTFLDGREPVLVGNG